MAKNRYINTHFWRDVWVDSLNPSDKLLFLYLISNPSTSICGAYEITLKQIALDTGFDKEMIEKMLVRFAEAEKVYYQDGWMVVMNFIKHQSLNPKVKKGIEIAVSDCPGWVKDRLCIAYDSLSHLNSNLNINSNSNLNSNHQLDDDVLGLYTSLTGNRITDQDRQIRNSLTADSIICQIGIAQAVLRAPEPIRSFKYCSEVINEVSQNPVENPAGYLTYLSNSIDRSLNVSNQK